MNRSVLSETFSESLKTAAQESCVDLPNFALLMSIAGAS